MSRRILIVEDDPLVTLMLEDYLVGLGYRIGGCADCVHTAMACLAAGLPDLAIVDVVLANGQSSSPVAQALAEAGIPFLVSTGGFIEKPDACFADRPLLMKPFALPLLKQALLDLR